MLPRGGDRNEARMTAGGGGHFCSVFVRREGIKGFFRENGRTVNWRFYGDKRGNDREEKGGGNC